jgi:hypothetical protein
VPAASTRSRHALPGGEVLPQRFPFISKARDRRMYAQAMRGGGHALVVHDEAKKVRWGCVVFCVATWRAAWCLSPAPPPTRPLRGHPSSLSLRALPAPQHFPCRPASKTIAFVCTRENRDAVLREVVLYIIREKHNALATALAEKRGVDDMADVLAAEVRD